MSTRGNDHPGFAPRFSNDTDSSRLVRANSDAYDYLVRAAKSATTPEMRLQGVARAANFASRFHPGRFADGDIENLAYEIGESLTVHSRPPVPDRPSSDTRRVLHVVTTVQGIGGHTRMLARWIVQDCANQHSVVVTAQGDLAVPRWLSDAVHHCGGELIVHDRGMSTIAKALSLRAKAQSGADLVVVHHSGFDVIPTTAFAVPGGPPVAILNHGDHLFWLGSSVADFVISLRACGSENAIVRRFARRAVVLPIPLLQPAQGIARAAARDRLGIQADCTVLLTVGRAIKFRPCAGFDFLQTASKIVDENPDTHLYVVGETAEGIAPYLNGRPHPKIHFVGPIEDPALYHEAADLYIESFPFGSNTALLEAALVGLPVVPSCSPLSPLLVAGNDALGTLLSNPNSEEAYRDRVAHFIANAEERVAFGEALRRETLAHHVGNPWMKHLADVYALSDKVQHRPQAIARTMCETREEDVGLALFHLMAGSSTARAIGNLHSAAVALRHAAYAAKDAGNFAGAARLSFRALLRDALSAASWRVLAVSLYGGVAQFLRPWSKSLLTTYRP